MIKAIIFDCFGVLTADPWIAFCATLPPGEGVERARKLNRLHDAGKISRVEFLQGVNEATGHPPEEIEALLHETHGKNTLLFDYIRQLKPHYKIGLLSNVATNWIRDYFLNEQEQQLFDAMVFSFEIGTTKPDKLIYDEVMKRLEVTADESVFIDDIERYAEGAKQIGMQGIWYKSFEQMKSDLEKLLTDQS